jgi:hypothetical protein
VVGDLVHTLRRAFQEAARRLDSQLFHIARRRFAGCASEQTLEIPWAELLAFCVGQTVHAVRLAHDSRTAPRFVAADKLAKAIDLDMADWWKATGESSPETLARKN